MNLFSIPNFVKKFKLVSCHWWCRW